jgi:hypothetical protein
MSAVRKIRQLQPRRSEGYKKGHIVHRLETVRASTVVGCKFVLS